MTFLDDQNNNDALGGAAIVGVGGVIAAIGAYLARGEIIESALQGLENLGAEFLSRLQTELEVRTPIDSTAIAAITYQVDRTLIVEFTDGTEYDIPNFPPAVLREWLAAPSKGGFWNRNVRGKYG
jgi:hypothetical protein